MPAMHRIVLAPSAMLLHVLKALVHIPRSVKDLLAVVVLRFLGASWERCYW